MFLATKGCCRKPRRGNLQLAPCLHKTSDQRGHVELGSPKACPEVVNSSRDELYPPPKKQKQPEILKNAQTWASSGFKNETKSNNEKNKPCVTQLLQLSSNPAGPLTGVTGCR